MNETEKVPLITTVIPTYRRPALLRRAIMSVLGQTWPHLRVCVFDNASGDETKNTVLNFAVQDRRVAYYVHPQNIGSYNNFNYGMKAVDTPYFSLLSDDDVLAPGFYAAVVAAFEKFPDAMFVAMPTMVVDAKLNVLSGLMEVAGPRYFRAGEGVEGMVNVTIPNTWTGIVFRKEVFDAIGFIPPEAGPFADGGFVWHAAARFPFVVVPGMAAALTAHPESTSGRVKPLDTSWPVWWEKMVRDIETDELVPPEIRAGIRRMVKPDFRKIGLLQVAKALVSGHPEIAVRAVQGLRDCGYPVASFLMRIFVWGYAQLFPVRWLLGKIRDHRQARLDAQRVVLGQKHAVEVDFLSGLNKESGVVE